MQLNSGSVLQESLEIGGDRSRLETFFEILIEWINQRLSWMIRWKTCRFTIRCTKRSILQGTVWYLKEYGVDKLCSINLRVVRGLDYYTGLVFEIKKKNSTGRVTLLGGGRYSNLISNFDSKAEISGVGFAVSDTALLAYLAEKDKLPNTSSKPTKVLVTVFNKETVKPQLQQWHNLRTEAIGGWTVSWDR